MISFLRKRLEKGRKPERRYEMRNKKFIILLSIVLSFSLVYFIFAQKELDNGKEERKVAKSRLAWWLD